MANRPSSKRRKGRKSKRTRRDQDFRAPHLRRDLMLKRRPIVELDDGTLGYAMVPDRWDDCFRSAIATTLQVPPNEIPDLRLDHRVQHGDDPDAINTDSWGTIHTWLATRGLRLEHHDGGAFMCPRWIGICPPPDAQTTAQVASEQMGRLGRGARRLAERRGLAGALTSSTEFTSHCLVMRLGQVLFDPACKMPPPPGYTGRTWQATDVAYGYTFEPIQ